jgi:hypothetical protein
MNDNLFPWLIRYLDHLPSHCGIHDHEQTDNDSEAKRVKPDDVAFGHMFDLLTVSFSTISAMSVPYSPFLLISLLHPP